MLSRDEQRAFEGFDGSSELSSDGDGSGSGSGDGEDEDEGEAAGEGEEGRKIPHLAPAAELHATPPRGLGVGMGRRAFDLDDGDGLEGFANSPAGEGEEVEEAVKAEERKGSLLGGLEDEGSGSGSASGDEEEEGVTMGMKGGETKAKGDLQRFWK